MRGGNQGEIRIASPKSVPKEQCRCLTRMFSIASLVVSGIQPLPILSCSVMISLHDLYNFRRPCGISEWPEH
ncbi:hypothetical protein, partial [Sinorhizobium medicae]